MQKDLTTRPHFTLYTFISLLYGLNTIWNIPPVAAGNEIPIYENYVDEFQASLC